MVPLQGTRKVYSARYPGCAARPRAMRWYPFGVQTAEQLIEFATRGSGINAESPSLVEKPALHEPRRCNMILSSQ
jgi:hypothetical protein